jgi:two-component system, LuxR family, sensor kinase FixL
MVNQVWVSAHPGTLPRWTMADPSTMSQLRSMYRRAVRRVRARLPTDSAEMQGKSAFLTLASPALLAFFGGALIIAIFVVDTKTKPDIAIAVLYAVGVLLAADFLQRRGVLLMALGCMALTVTSYLLSHGFAGGAPLVRCIIGLSAISATTSLVLKNQSSNTALRERARLLDLTHDAIFVRDMNAVITYCNRGAEELYGCRADELVGKVSFQLLKTVFPAPLEEIRAELLRTGRWEGELVHTRKNGTPITVSSRWSLQRDEHGRPVAIIGTSNDVSERNRAQKAFHRAQAELAHVSRLTTLGELTASIAHEVNQPLAALVTHGAACLRWLALAPPDLDEARGAAESMISDGMRAGEVVSRLRSLSRKAGVERVRLRLNEITEQVVALLQRELINNGIVLRLDLAPRLPFVLGDRVQLQQVIMNLLINGIQAMAPVTDRPRELLICSNRYSQTQALLEVRDSGIGIDADNTKCLFEAFFTTKPEGMGMGLSICRSIIEAHGGNVWARCNPGPGATFQFTVPLCGESGL